MIISGIASKAIATPTREGELPGPIAKRWVHPEPATNQQLEASDVVCGRGTAANKHEGNKTYVETLAPLRRAYKEASPGRERKQKVMEALTAVRDAGIRRFIMEVGGRYHVLTVSRTIYKIGQFFRDKAKGPSKRAPPVPPDVTPCPQVPDVDLDGYEPWMIKWLEDSLLESYDPDLAVDEVPSAGHDVEACHTSIAHVPGDLTDEEFFQSLVDLCD